MTTRSASTRWAERVLALWMPADEAGAIVQDLEELRVRGGRGRIWFWWEVAGFPARLGMERARGALRGDGRRGRGRMDGLRRDLGYAVRGLRKKPGFTITAALVLAIAVGATTAVFSVVQGVLLAPLPYPDSDRVHALWIQKDRGERARMTPGNFRDLQGLDVFSSVAAFGPTSGSFEVDGEQLYVRGGRVTPEYFETLGIPFAAGRGFTEEDALEAAAPTLVLGYDFWQRTFGGDPGVVGRTVDVHGSAFRVLGVAGPGLYPTSVLISGELPFTRGDQDFFIPIWHTAEAWENRRSHVFGAIARRAPDVSVEVATEALAAFSAGMREGDPVNREESIVLTPIEDEIVGEVRLALVLLLGAVGLVLAIAVVNVGALFVLSGDDRAQEVRIRLALGAPRRRVVRQLLTESTLVTGLAAAAGLALAVAGVELMKRAVPYQIPRMEGVEMNAAVLAAAIGVSALLALGFGTAPAWRLLRRTGSSSRSVTAGRARRRLQGGVVLVQSALGVVVLVGAALLARSFASLQSTDPGFDHRDAWVFEITGFRIDEEALVREIRTIPGVATAALTYDHPLERNWEDGFGLPGRALDPDTRIGGSLRPIGAGYFEAAGISTLDGRVPTAAEFSGSTRYAVVNASFRDAWFADESPVGHVVDIPAAARMFGEDASEYVIAAVVEDVRFLGPEAGSEPAVYLPRDHFQVGWSAVLVHPEAPDLALAGPVAEVVRRVAPGAAIQNAARLGDLLDDALARPRFNMVLLVAFAGIGLALCGLGAYGLVGRIVATRRREIGIRMALGARSGTVARGTIGQALLPMLVGVGAGLVLASFLSGMLTSLLFEIVPGDPASFLLGGAFMLTTGAVAATLPTLRALRIDPAGTLREE